MIKDIAKFLPSKMNRLNVKMAVAINEPPKSLKTLETIAINIPSKKI